MACQELVELVTSYLDDALTPRDRARFEAHIDGCDDCTVYVAQFKQTVAALGTLDDGEPQPASLDALLQVFRSWAPEGDARARDPRA